jgi:hypothetical protein
LNTTWGKFCQDKKDREVERFIPDGSGSDEESEMEPLDQEKEDVVMEELSNDIEPPEMPQRIATDVQVVPMKDRKRQKS